MIELFNPPKIEHPKASFVHRVFSHFEDPDWKAERDAERRAYQAEWKRRKVERTKQLARQDAA